VGELPGVAADQFRLRSRRREGATAAFLYGSQAFSHLHPLAFGRLSHLIILASIISPRPYTTTTVLVLISSPLLCDVTLL
jgi:hypothetical protein